MFRLYDLEEQYIRYPEIRRDEVLKLLQWSLGQYYLPKITEHEALLFFTASGCNLADSKELLVKNASYRTHFKEFFDDLDIKSHQIELIQKTVYV